MEEFHGEITHFISLAQAKHLRATFEDTLDPVMKPDGNGGAIWVTREPKELSPMLERVLARIEHDALRNEYRDEGSSKD